MRQKCWLFEEVAGEFALSKEESTVEYKYTGTFILGRVSWLTDDASYKRICVRLRSLQLTCLQFKDYHFLQLVQFREGRFIIRSVNALNAWQHCQSFFHVLKNAHKEYWSLEWWEKLSYRMKLWFLSNLQFPTCTVFKYLQVIWSTTRCKYYISVPSLYC